MLLDTSGLLAAIDASQRRHEACKAALLSAKPPLRLSPFVLAEIDYLLGTRVSIDAELALLEQVAVEVYYLESFTSADITDVHRIVEKYRDTGIGLSDASIVVLSERYGTLDVLTLDLRHFGAIRGAKGRPFRIWPQA